MTAAEPDPLDLLDEVLAPADATAAARNRFSDVHCFVTEYLCTVWARTIRDPDNSFRWCSRWWAHPVALDRLTALWQAFEALHAEGGTSPARWWREYADPTLASLTDPRAGAFAGCRPGRHQLPPALPTDAIGDGGGADTDADSQATLG